MTERVVRIAARGDGVTENGRFLPLAAPGDLFDGDILVEPGPHRAVPPCRHFPECGGCQLQHVDDAAYAGFLVERIAGALGAQGLEAAEIRAPLLSPPRTRRRASLRALRTAAGVAIGFNAEASHRIIDMRECHVLRPELFNLLKPLRGLLATMLPMKRAAGIRMTLADQGVDLLIEGVTADGLEAAEAITAFAAQHGIARLAIDEGYGPQSRWEPAPVSVHLGDIPVHLPDISFLQATIEGETALIEAVREIVGPAPRVADLFAGIGTFALSLDARVLAVEGARDAAAALLAAARRSGRQVAVEHRDLFRRPLEGKELERFDAVVIDPPRAGAQEQARALAASPVPVIASVSCNPNTFARDAAILVAGGYRLKWIQPVGQFRWSTHVELVGCFER